MSFFTPLEKYLMSTKLKYSSNTNLTGSARRGWQYVTICYTMFTVLFIAGMVNVIAEGMHNTKMMNNDKGLNIGLTSTQVVTGSILVVLSITAFIMHYRHNSQSYINDLVKNGFSMEQFRTYASLDGITIGYLWYVMFFIFLIFCYGMMQLIFSADRLLCTTSGSCSITKFTAEEQAALRV